jgi:hypothetical protein
MEKLLDFAMGIALALVLASIHGAILSIWDWWTGKGDSW